MTFGLEHNCSHLDFVLFNKKLMDFQVISLNITLEFKLYNFVAKGRNEVLPLTALRTLNKGGNHMFPLF